jgi:hypothetical protein
VSYSLGVPFLDAPQVPRTHARTHGVCVNTSAMLIHGVVRWLLIPFVMASTCAGAIWSAMKDVAGVRYARCHSRVVRRVQEVVSFVCQLISAPSPSTAAPANMPPSLNRGRRGRLQEAEDEDRTWGNMRGRPRQTRDVARDRVDYFVLAQMYEMDANRPPHDHASPSASAGFPPLPASARPSTAGNSDASYPHAPRRASAPTHRQTTFTAEEQHYLHSRLPIRQPATAATAVNHFRRLPFLYSDLAEGYRLRLASIPRGTQEWQRRQRMAMLAQTLADRYNVFNLVLPRSYIETIITQNQSETRTSKFWEKVLNEVEVRFSPSTYLPASNSYLFPRDPTRPGWSSPSGPSSLSCSRRWSPSRSSSCRPQASWPSS